MSFYQQQKISEYEYLSSELVSEVKHEFIDGIVYAMAAASADHGRISGNLFAAFLGHLQNQKLSCKFSQPPPFADQ
ncbi:MAG: Uma2 family endonuclease [Candidatus Electrothrix communis]|nr:Uma2 family endonuclease [Desulfobulbus sp. US4]WLE98341.1 MAG: Uma2 family endonuclease [Candidatus Electrothrix communis]